MNIVPITGIISETSTQNLLSVIQQIEILKKVWNMFKVNNKNVRKNLSYWNQPNDLQYKSINWFLWYEINLMFLLLILNIFHTFFLSFYYWLWTSKCLLGIHKLLGFKDTWLASLTGNTSCIFEYVLNLWQSMVSYKLWCTAIVVELVPKSLLSMGNSPYGLQPKQGCPKAIWTSAILSLNEKPLG